MQLTRIAKIVRSELSRIAKTKTIVLFGSIVEERCRRTSDVDVLLVTERKFPEEKIEKIENKLSEEIGRRVEIFNMSEKGLMEAVEEGSPLLLTIFKKCKVVYDKENLLQKMRNLFVALHAGKNFEVRVRGKKVKVSELKWP